MVVAHAPLRAIVRAWILVVVAGLGTLLAQGATPVALMHVNVIPMDKDGILPDQTVVVRDGVITAIGPAADTVLPEGTTVIDGAGRYLVPGLVDSHIHIDSKIGARPDFGDAPLFLSYGITTVINLRGEPEHVVLKERIRSGEILAPNLYTSGEFVNEPRVNTPDEAEREVENQRRAGYDLIKFREVIDFEKHRVATTHGLARPAYLRLNEAARRAGMPLVGHHPYNLDLADVLAAGQSLAHTNELANQYFLPPLDVSSGMWIALARWSFLALAAVLLVWAAYRGALRLLRRRPVELAPTVEAARSLALLVAVLAVATSIVWLVVVPPGLAFGNAWLLLLLSALGVGVLFVSALLVRGAFRAWRAPGVSMAPRMLVSIVALAAVGTAASGAHWIPFAWRGWDPWIAHVAKRCKIAGISVQSTLICQETGMATREGYRIPQQLAAPDFRFLSEELQDEWRGITAFAPRWMTVLWKRHPEFVRKLAGALHEAGVPVMAGTDALGAPFIIPGISLHREMQLLAESGFAPREILESATIVPARFLGREAEFGTITVGKRADLLLVEGNPLEDLDRLRRPAGVMVRGIWQFR